MKATENAESLVNLVQLWKAGRNRDVQVQKTRRAYVNYVIGVRNSHHQIISTQRRSTSTMVNFTYSLIIELFVCLCIHAEIGKAYDYVRKTATRL